MQPDPASPDARRQLIGRLAEGVAHDAANLLAVARLVADSLAARSDLPPDVLAKVASLTAAVHDAGELLQRLALVSGRRPSVAHAVALAALLDELRPLLRAALGGRAITVTGSAVAFADRAVVEAAIVELVVGERRGTGEAPLELHVGTEGDDAVVAVRGRDVRFPVLRRGGVVLVVEDDPDLRELVRESLRADGYDVVAVGDAAAAVGTSAYVDGHVQLLVTDVELPGSSGLDLAAAVIEQGVPVVVMSGHGEASLGDDMPKGVVVLDKPFGVPQLRAQVRHALGS